MRSVRILIGLALVLLTGCGSAGQTPDANVSTMLHGTPVGESMQLPDIVLRDTSNQAYRLASTPSSPVVVVVFGYTHCGAQCSATPAILSEALATLPPEERSQVTGLFITVDPARDWPDTIASWLTANAPELVGLTGEATDIEQVAAQLGVPISGKQHHDGGYVVGHGTHITAFDRSRAAVVVWDRNTAPSDLRDDLQVLVTR